MKLLALQILFALPAMAVLEAAMGGFVGPLDSMCAGIVAYMFSTTWLRSILLRDLK